jgi:mono/diheme cytochrome c family protein
MASGVASLGPMTTPAARSLHYRLASPTVVLLVIIVSAVRAKNPIQDTHERSNQSGVTPTTRIAHQLFEEHCATCHGDDGRGREAADDFPTIPDFLSSSWQRSRSDAQLAASILNGRGDGMPSFSEGLRRSQVSSLVNYIRSLAPETVNRPEARTTEFARKYAELKDEWDALARELADLQSHN